MIRTRTRYFCQVCRTAPDRFTGRLDVAGEDSLRFDAASAHQFFVSVSPLQRSAADTHYKNAHNTRTTRSSKVGLLCLAARTVSNLHLISSSSLNVNIFPLCTWEADVILVLTTLQLTPYPKAAVNVSSNRRLLLP